jgi:hypothetical protein
MTNAGASRVKVIETEQNYSSDRLKWMPIMALSLLPLMLLWRSYTVLSSEFAVQVHWSLFDYVTCYIQDITIWSIIFLIVVWMSNGQNRWTLFTTFFLTNAALLTQIIDARTKLKFLEPLSPELIWFATEEISSLSSSFELFAGVNFWKGALMSHLLLCSLGIFLIRYSQLLNAIFSKITFGRTVSSMTFLLGLSCALSASASGQKSYGLQQNFIFSVLSIMTKEAVPGYYDHAVRYSPEPVRYSKADDFKHTSLNSVAMAKGMNVILYILESTPHWAVEEAEKATTATLFKELEEAGGLYIPSYSTFAVSTKSIYTMLSGMYGSPSAEVLESKIENLTGLPRALEDAGYHTEFISNQNLHYQATRRQIENLGYKKVSALAELVTIAKQKSIDVSHEGFGSGDDRLMLVDGFKKLKQKQPFFATYYSSASHYPYEYPGSLPGSDFEKHQRSIEFSQAVIRKMLKELEAEGMAENTLVVITADHGEEFQNGSFRGRGTSLSDETHVVPLLFYIPGRNIEGDFPEYTRHIDLTPSILDMVGVAPIGLPIQGSSIFNEPATPEVYLNTIGRTRSIGFIEPNQKVIHSLDTGETYFGQRVSSDALLARDDSGIFEQRVRDMKAFSIYNEALLRDLSTSSKGLKHH